MNNYRKKKRKGKQKEALTMASPVKLRIFQLNNSNDMNENNLRWSKWVTLYIRKQTYVTCDSIFESKRMSLLTNFHHRWWHFLKSLNLYHWNLFVDMSDAIIKILVFLESLSFLSHSFLILLFTAHIDNPIWLFSISLNYLIKKILMRSLVS